MFLRSVALMALTAAKETGDRGCPSIAAYLTVVVAADCMTRLI
ncbi:hypothetical protein [Stenomitos frigidus]|nr:hypothetical protein [Stenomitos frigidus]